MKLTKVVSVVVLLMIVVVVSVPAAIAQEPVTALEVPLVLEGEAVCDPWSCKLPPGWTGTIPSFVTISGDVRVNGQPMYDTLQETGLVVYTGPAIASTSAISLTAEWGADAKYGDWLQQKGIV